MKKNKKNRKKKVKPVKNYQTKKTETKSQQSEMPVFQNGESYYIYNLAKMFVPENTGIFLELQGSGHTVGDIFLKGISDTVKNSIVFYCIDAYFIDDEKKHTFLEHLNLIETCRDKIEILPLTDLEGNAHFKDKQADIIFIHGENGNLYQTLCAWYPKLKENGWLSGYISVNNRHELEEFAIGMNLSYSIISMPMSREIFELYSTDTSSNLNKIKDFLNLGMLGEARDISNQIMLQYPHSPFLANLKAELDYSCGFVRDARALFKKIVEKWPYYVRALNNLGAIEANLGNLDNARTIFGKVLQIDPFDYDAKNNLKEVERLLKKI